MTIAGIDIGGTNVRMVLLDQAGHVVTRAEQPTRPEAGPEESIGRIIARLRQLTGARRPAALRAIGIGITGPVDPRTAVVTNPHTLTGWPPTDVRAPFVAAFAVPVAVDNDANVAAVGEAWAGAGRGYLRPTMITVGTGIGVASLVAGKVQRTVDGRHGDAGHMVIDGSGPPCYCGANGCLEILASGTALEAQARELAGSANGLRGHSGRPERATAYMLFAAAADGDAAAIAAVSSAAHYLGLGMVNLASTVMPDVFILAGGVVEHFSVLKPTVTEVLRRHAVMIPTDIPVVASELGAFAGAIGAAKTALDLTTGKTEPDL